MSVASPYAVFPPPRYVHSAKSMCGSYQPTNIQKELAFSYQRRSLLPTDVLKELALSLDQLLSFSNSNPVKPYVPLIAGSPLPITPYHTLSHPITL